MDMSSSCSPLQLQGSAPFLFDCEDLLKQQTHDAGSDPGYFSCCSSLSPTSSVDSFSFSPPASLPCGASGPDPLDCFVFSTPAPRIQEQKPQTLPVQGTRKPRSRYPGQKRQTASEREKLRMRDLTKALTHLRGYLPASVVPAGQTLTKIETLRLTIRYISHLSAQLGLSEDGLSQRSTGAVDQTQNQSQNQTQYLDQAQNQTRLHQTQHQIQNQTQHQTQYLDQTQHQTGSHQTQHQTQYLDQTQFQTQYQAQSSTAAHYSPQAPCYNTMEDETISYHQSQPAPHFSALPHSYQMSSDVCYAAQSAPQEYWTPLQLQQQLDMFSGLC